MSLCTGLAASCETLLLSEMSVIRMTPIILNGGNIGLMHNNTLTGLVASDGRTMKTNNVNSSNFSSINNSTNTTTKSQTTNLASINYKFFVPRYVDVIALHFNIWNICAECPAIALKVQANALPTWKSFIHRHIIYANKTGETIMDFYPQQNAWHYVEIMFATSSPSTRAGDDSANATTSKSAHKTKPKFERKQFVAEVKNVSFEFGISLDFINERIVHDLLRDDPVTISANNSNENTNTSSTVAMDLVDATNNSSSLASSSSSFDNAFGYDEHEMNGDEYANDVEDDTVDSDKLKSPRNIKYYALLRQTYREFFMFDYDLLPDDNGTVPTFINLTAGTPTGFRFELGNVYDIGGTLSFAVVMKDNLKDAAAAVATTASASLIRPRTHIESDTAVAEKLVHVNTGDGSMNYELDHLNVNDVEEINGYNVNDDTPGRSNQTIIICMRLGEPGIPTWPDKCVYGRHILPAASIVNNTNDETSTGLIHVPFPESGMWYVTLGVYCHGAETAARITIIDSVKEFIKKYVDLLHDMRVPCACANRTTYYQKCIADHQCLDALNESETLKVKECLMDSKCTSRHHEMAHKFELHHKFATEQSVATGGSCNASAVFTVSSSPCVAGRCGRYGRCYHYMSGGFVFSTCLCIKGYRGWDCTEDSQVPSSLSILVALLLLTLSNLLFIPSIYFAVRRKYYTEGIIYFFAMFFSIFYHACDSGEDEYSFCLVKIGVLQFCDFYCGLLAIWVTLIAMAHFRDVFVSMLHMFGAIVLAFGTELNKQSLWVFLAPALTGLCLISISWGWRCRRTRKWFPARKYLSIFLPIGMVFVMIGLVCYAFLQTRQNYHIVHSVWHMLMALSILCLLPSRKSFLPKC